MFKKSPSLRPDPDGQNKPVARRLIFKSSVLDFPYPPEWHRTQKHAWQDNLLLRTQQSELSIAG
jgi:hypothetical protein